LAVEDCLERLDAGVVAASVLSLPAIVIDGELVFSSLPTPQQLRTALICRNAKGK
jgi:thioredoxin 1